MELFTNLKPIQVALLVLFVAMKMTTIAAAFVIAGGIFDASLRPLGHNLLIASIVLIVTTIGLGVTLMVKNNDK